MRVYIFFTDTKYWQHVNQALDVYLKGLDWSASKLSLEQDNYA